MYRSDVLNRDCGCVMCWSEIVVSLLTGGYTEFTNRWLHGVY